MAVLGELMAGVEFSKSRARNIEIVERNPAPLSSLALHPGSSPGYGRLFAELRRIGRQMQAIDIQIAVIALSLGRCIVVSRDTDLFFVPGLSVQDRASST